MSPSEIPLESLHAIPYERVVLKGGTTPRSRPYILIPTHRGKLGVNVMRAATTKNPDFMDNPWATFGEHKAKVTFITRFSPNGVFQVQKHTQRVLPNKHHNKPKTEKYIAKEAWLMLECAAQVIKKGVEKNGRVEAKTQSGETIIISEGGIPLEKVYILMLEWTHEGTIQVATGYKASIAQQPYSYTVSQLIADNFPVVPEQLAYLVVPPANNHPPVPVPPALPHQHSPLSAPAISYATSYQPDPQTNTHLVHGSASHPEAYPPCPSAAPSSISFTLPPSPLPSAANQGWGNSLETHYAAHQMLPLASAQAPLPFAGPSSSSFPSGWNASPYDIQSSVFEQSFSPPLPSWSSSPGPSSSSSSGYSEADNQWKDSPQSSPELPLSSSISAASSAFPIPHHHSPSASSLSGQDTKWQQYLPQHSGEAAPFQANSPSYTYGATYDYPMMDVFSQSYTSDGGPEAGSMGPQYAQADQYAPPADNSLDYRSDSSSNQLNQLPSTLNAPRSSDVQYATGTPGPPIVRPRMRSFGGTSSRTPRRPRALPNIPPFPFPLSPIASIPAQLSLVSSCIPIPLHKRLL